VILFFANALLHNNSGVKFDVLFEKREFYASWIRVGTNLVTGVNTKGRAAEEGMSTAFCGSKAAGQAMPQHGYAERPDGIRFFGKCGATRNDVPGLLFCSW